jgi:hypothetical protein
MTKNTKKKDAKVLLPALKWSKYIFAQPSLARTIKTESEALKKVSKLALGTSKY